MIFSIGFWRTVLLHAAIWGTELQPRGQGTTSTMWETPFMDLHRCCVVLYAVLCLPFISRTYVEMWRLV